MGKPVGKALLLAVAAALLLAAVWAQDLRPAAIGLHRPLKHVRVTGTFEHLGKDELKAALLPHVGGGFFEVDITAVQQAAAGLPWVRKAQVRRVWPDTLEVAVEERVPYARWGGQGLITEQGEVFMPPNLDAFAHLVKVAGPVQQRRQVLAIMQGVRTALADSSLALAEFHVNQRWSWTVKLDGGLVILLGRERQLEKLQRFLKTLPLLPEGRAQAMAVADLRYPNGYAVSWRDGMADFDWAALSAPHPAAGAARKKQER